jgi:hypothetical protein
MANEHIANRVEVGAIGSITCSLLANELIGHTGQIIIR